MSERCRQPAEQNPSLCETEQRAPEQSLLHPGPTDECTKPLTIKKWLQALDGVCGLQTLREWLTFPETWCGRGWHPIISTKLILKLRLRYRVTGNGVGPCSFRGKCPLSRLPALLSALSDATVRAFPRALGSQVSLFIRLQAPLWKATKLGAWIREPFCRLENSRFQSVSSVSH